MSDQSSYVERHDAMERMLLAYENNMRLSAFQCCMVDSHVAGFRMHQTEFALEESELAKPKIASTGCIGSCEKDSCFEEVPFEYTNIDEFQLEFILAQTDEESTLDEQVNIMDIFVSGQSICKESQSIDDYPELTWVESFDITSIPVGFEYTFDHERHSFGSLTLV